MSRLALVGIGLVLATLAAPAPPAAASGPDPHALYEAKCGGCHEEHARDFTENQLRLEDGRVLARRSGMALDRFLATGHGDVAPENLDVLVGHLSAVARAGGLFERKCRICHDRAVVLARRELVIRDGRLVGRYTGRDIEAFLTHHGRLTEHERAVMLDTLQRQLRTATE